MTQLSSNSTLFWRIFLPIFSTVAVSLLSLAAILNEDVSLFGFTGLLKNAFFLLFWFLILYIVFKTGWKLRRIEADADGFVVTDFWKNARITWDSVERVEAGKLLWVHVVDIYLHEPSVVFGQRISFRPSKSNIKHFLAENPDAWAIFGKVKELRD